MAVRRPIVFDTPDFVEQLQVPQDAGTPTGNMTAGGGLAAAFDGDVWQWHQDYGTWKNDDDMPEARAMNIAIF